MRGGGRRYECQHRASGTTTWHAPLLTRVDVGVDAGGRRRLSARPRQQRGTELDVPRHVARVGEPAAESCELHEGGEDVEELHGGRDGAGRAAAREAQHEGHAKEEVVRRAGPLLDLGSGRSKGG